MKRRATVVRGKWKGSGPTASQNFVSRDMCSE